MEPIAVDSPVKLPTPPAAAPSKIAGSPVVSAAAAALAVGTGAAPPLAAAAAVADALLPPAPAPGTPNPAPPVGLGRVLASIGIHPTKRRVVMAGAALCSLAIGVTGVRMIWPRTTAPKVDQPIAADAAKPTAEPEKNTTPEPVLPKWSYAGVTIPTAPRIEFTPTNLPYQTALRDFDLAPNQYELYSRSQTVGAGPRSIAPTVRHYGFDYLPAELIAACVWRTGLIYRPNGRPGELSPTVVASTAPTPVLPPPSLSVDPRYADAGSVKPAAGLAPGDSNYPSIPPAPGSLLPSAPASPPSLLPAVPAAPPSILPPTPPSGVAPPSYPPSVVPAGGIDLKPPPPTPGSLLPAAPSSPMLPALPAAPSAPSVTPTLPTAPSVAPPVGPSLDVPKPPDSLFPPVGPSSPAPPASPSVVPPAPPSGLAPPVGPSSPSGPSMLPPVGPSSPSGPSMLPPVGPSSPSGPSVAPPVGPSSPSGPSMLPPVGPSSPTAPGSPGPLLPEPPKPVAGLPVTPIGGAPQPPAELNPKLDYTKPVGGSTALPANPVVDNRPAPSNITPQTSFDVDLYEPRAGDSYSSISRDFYNETRYARALEEYNRRRPLTGGGHVEIPPIHVLMKRFPQLMPAAPAPLPETPKGTLPPAVNFPPAPVFPSSPAPSAPLTSSPLPTEPRPAAGSFGPPGKKDEIAPDFRPSNSKIYRVKTNGMTIPLIAEQTLGSKQRWSEIWEMNKQITAPGDYLPINTELKLPSDAKVPE